jgi:hypothetical protein
MCRSTDQLQIKQKVNFSQLLNRPLLILDKPNDHLRKNIDLSMENHIHLRTVVGTKF